MLTNKTKKFPFFVIFALSIFILIFLFLQNKFSKNPHIWDFERLAFNQPELLAYQEILQEYNHFIFNYTKKKHNYSLNEYYNYFFFENKFKNFEELNNYLIEYNNFYKKNLQIKKKDIIYVKIKPDTKFQLRYYGNDVEKLNEFIEFMNNSIKSKLLAQLIQQQKNINQNVIYDDQKVFDNLKKDYFFHRLIYLNNLEFQLKNKTRKTLTIKKSNECLYYLGFQHEYSEIPQIIKIILENKNYVFKQFNECMEDNVKKKIENLSSDLNNSFLNSITSLNEKIIHINILKENKYSTAFTKTILNIFSFIILIFAIFFYRNHISFFIKKILT